MNEITSIDLTGRYAEEAEPVPTRPRHRRIAWLALALGVLVAAWLLLRGHEALPAAPPIPVVAVATPLQREVTEWDDYIGRFEASRSVEVRPRVSGQITAVHFRDGEIVRQGQPLFTIDSRPYRAELAEAQAGVATAASDLTLAQSDLARAQRLVAADAVAASEIDSLKAHVRAAQAALAAAKARVRTHALDVEFTTVRAPMSGRISDRRVDAGNLVAAGDGPSATLLTTINALDPIYFSFEGSEGLFLKAKRQGADSGTQVAVRLEDESDYRWQGTLDFTDNGLDPHSGTMRARAVLHNPDLFLTPGMFGNMRLASGGKVNALLVPDTAVQTDQTRKILLVVGKDGTVAAKTVTLGPVIGGLRVIRSGISASDRIVIQGTQMAVPGGKVKANAGRIAPGPDDASVAPPSAAPAEATFAR